LDALANTTIRLQDGSDLEIVELVRVVPNKRAVCLATWQSETVYAKLFFGEKSAYYAARDAAGIQALSQAKIATPALRLATQAPEIKADVLVIQAHTSAENLETLMAQATPKRRLQLATQVVEVLAEQHQANLIQTDLYFKNFLLDQTTILTIDGDGIRQYANLSHAKAIENLSILISKLDVLEVEAWLPELLARYQAVNGSLPIEIETIKRSSKKQRTQAVCRYADKKVFRQCTDVNVQNNIHMCRQ